MIYHIGILGGGNISETHLRAALETDGVKVTAVSGRNREKVERLAVTCGAASYTGLEEFLAHRPMEVVLIGSPSGLHAEQGIAAARQGLHVLVEKPIDVNTDRADQLIRECKKAGVKLGIIFQDRMGSDIQQLKQMLKANQLGRPLLVSAHVRWWRTAEYYGASKWRGTWELDGGAAVVNQGIHTLDLLLWLLGPVRQLSAFTRTLVHDIEAEDAAVIALEFEGGTLGMMEASTCAYPGYPRRVVLTGTEGTVILKNDQIVSLSLRSGEKTAAAGERDQTVHESSPVVSDVRNHRKVIEDFLEAIRKNRAPLCDGPDARRSLELVQAIYRSSETGQIIRLM